ncbi:MAG: EutN/CcmL family microcompartment protein [Acidimicrobiales bacterium]
MLLGEVVGRIWFSRQRPQLEGRRMVVVRDISTSHLHVAVDLIGVSAGNNVVLTTDESAMTAVDNAPVDAVVVALVSGADEEVMAGGSGRVVSATVRQ